MGDARRLNAVRTKFVCTHFSYQRGGLVPELFSFYIYILTSEKNIYRSYNF